MPEHTPIHDLSPRRRERLALLVGNERGAIRLFFEKIGYGSYSYWRHLLDPDKPFGEKAARRIEQALGLPLGWMDSAQLEGDAVSSGDRDETEKKLLPLREQEKDLLLGFRQLVAEDQAALVQKTRELLTARNVDLVEAITRLHGVGAASQANVVTLRRNKP